MVLLWTDIGLHEENWSIHARLRVVSEGKDTRSSITIPLIFFLLLGPLNLQFSTLLILVNPRVAFVGFWLLISRDSETLL